MSTKRHGLALSLGILVVLVSIAASAQKVECPPPARTITVNMSALDQPFFLNRLGALMPEGMVYALDRDIQASTCPKGQTCKPSKGNARLRDSKRPRPIVLRANQGDCLAIHFTNLLADAPANQPGIKGVQPSTRQASVHVAGMQVVRTIRDDGSYVGVNQRSTVAPGSSITYLIRATEQGTFLLNSEGAAWGGLDLPNDGAQVTAGLFGAVNVEPPGAVWLRSQIKHDQMQQAIDHSKGNNGLSPLGQPFLNFDSPILQMLDANNELVATDLTAIIAGPKSNGYLFPKSGDPNTSPVPYEPGRDEPFREFTIEYHELSDSQQAFPIFNYGGASLTKTLQAAGDAFAINYGTGGIGAEILANRFGLGPMNSCTDCRFEEFFLSSWTVGDPAMRVDYPANAPCSGTTLKSPPEVTNTAIAKANCTEGVKGNAPKGVTPLRKATMVMYPDDPSNIYHSYINDRVIFRTLHAGTGVSHVHHLHAHQWFHSPNSAGSVYLDSQLINPGSAYTMEIAHEGSGNLNKVVGDSIFHCHFYPHFAAGMWAHWRSHDVFEIGTQLDSYGKPVDGWNRAQPDGEIAAGTPIPALVPMPTKPMAPMPARVRIVAVKDPNNPGGPVVGWRAETNADDLKAGLNPGYPFFIPGVGGTRAPHPPLDFAVDGGQTLDGGLPRHMVINAKITGERHNYLDFSKDMEDINAYQLPEDGTDVEKVAMNYHSQCTHPTFKPDATPAKYRTNGLPPAHGAPYADPGIATPTDSDTCAPIKEWTEYRAAVIQTDAVINKLGWHYPQTRLLTLWGDVLPTVDNVRPPQPFFFRANSRTGVNYWHTNLVPSYYALDDYQVRTPTDIIGQHIHLVKFDVTSSDGAANGFNYEDGTLSYEEVKDQIKGITECGGLASDLATIQKCGTGTRAPLTAKAPPTGICPDPNEAHCKEWVGAQTTVQRWYADPLDDKEADQFGERTLQTVFTHDHFGPSTHQQTGLYAALIVEPTGSKWYTNDANKTQMHTRADGGPTWWDAVIESPGDSGKNTRREFAIGLQDFQFAYQPNSISKPHEVKGTETLKGGKTVPVVVEGSWADPKNAVEPIAIQGSSNVPGPQIISAGPTPGTLTFNYRNEPLPFRVAPGSSTNSQATDLSYVFSSQVTRNITALNSQPAGGTSIGSSGFTYAKDPLSPGMTGGDPYTPLMRAYEGDPVVVRVIVGAHMLPHDFTIHGVKWRFENFFADSGYRSNQSMGISEHFEFFFDTPRASPASNTQYNWSDYLYMPDASNQNHGIIDGMWGLFRAYKSPQKDLPPLSTNPEIAPLPPPTLKSGYSCPPDAPVRAFTVNATSPGALSTYNSRGVDGFGKFPSTKITNPYQMMYSYQATTPPGGGATNVTPNIDEPLVLRANTGECVALTLKNAFTQGAAVFQQQSFAKFVPPSQYFPSTKKIPLMPSYEAGTTPALMSYDVMASGGMNIGYNPNQTVPYQQQKTYYWYAGQTQVDRAGRITGIPIEFGGANVTPSDPLEQDNRGLVGGLIVEPNGSVACPDTFNPRSNLPTYASATVYDGGSCSDPGKLRHREFVLVTQDDMASLTWPSACYCAARLPTTNDQCTPCASAIETAVSPQKSLILLQTVVNYRTEPMTYRFNATAFVNLTTVYRGYSDGWVLAEPQTPIFAAARHTPVRFHLLHPGGAGDQQILAVHGHVWQELPYTNDSTSIGDNKLSMNLGKRDNYGTNTSYSIILERNGGAGGVDGVTGDYLYRTTPANFVTQGLWGIFRVAKSGSDAVSLAAAQFSSGGLQVAGSSTVFLDDKANPKNGQRAATVTLTLRKRGTTTEQAFGTPQVGEGGLWSMNQKINFPSGAPEDWDVVASSPLGGTATIPITQTLLPSTPASAQSSDALGESIRFENTPREGDTPKTIPAGKPQEGLAAPKEPGVPTAPKSQPTPPPPQP
jgi:hypothetical protein